MMPWELVIFDCDGVLVDSERLSNRVLAQLLAEIGLPMSLEDTIATFMGLTMDACVAIIEQRTGRLTLSLTGLLPRFDGRIFSAVEVARGKPYPDLFLYTAEKMAVAPADGRAASIAESRAQAVAR